MKLTSKHLKALGTGVGLSCLSATAFASEIFTDAIQLNPDTQTYTNMNLCAPGPNNCIGLFYNGLALGELAIFDFENQLRPVRLRKGAPNDTIVMDTTGQLGLGTDAPNGIWDPRLVIAEKDGIRAGLRFISDASSFTLVNDADRFFIYNQSANTYPFYIENAAPNNSLNINKLGKVGIGTGADETLHVASPVDTAILVENTDLSSTSEQLMFNLRNRGSGKVRFGITSDSSTWTFDNIPQLNSFSISRVGTGANEFRVDGSGDGTFRGNSYAVQHFNTSSRESKTDFTDIDVQGILAGVLSLPVSQWRYKSETQDERHIGPIAEDFEEVFNLGDGKTISTVDASGIAFAAIQGLKIENDSRIEQKDAEIAGLRESLSQQEERMLQMEMALAELMRDRDSQMRVSAAD